MSAASGRGEAMYGLVRELYPICRSITGDGLRQTLRRLAADLPLALHEVPSGTQVLDWTVPDEWNIRDAYVADSSGRRVIDFKRHSLHVVNYSEPVRLQMTLDELRPHLHALPDHPDWIPYRTSYYRRSWGFCLAQRELDQLTAGTYEVVIDSTLAPGALTYGEAVLPGQVSDEVLLSVHSCHPSLANDNLAGMAVASELLRWITALPERHYTYRFLFIPGTIGSIAWLALHRAEVGRIRHGLVLSCLGDAGQPTYKRSRRGNAPIDRIVTQVLRHAGPHAVQEFSPYGYDERQYCSPGFNLAVGRLSRTPNGAYPEYHTSADNPDFISAGALEHSLDVLQQVVEILEHDRTWINLSPFGEPQLGRRGLYRTTGGTELPAFELAVLWVLNQSDGRATLLDTAERAGIPFSTIRRAADALAAAGLLTAAPATAPRATSLPASPEAMSDAGLGHRS